ncbi:MAG: hypothetical protein DHS20C01_15020 [marine bacterium B5-7]|nr:MAG: hypothetical protein DHS20C01_15020 [marine bacterium B5-7]
MFYRTIVCLLFIPLWLATSVFADDGYRESKVMFKTSNTVVGEPISYPSGTAQLTAMQIILAPGEKTDWHKHGTPLFAYMLQGELMVDYGDHGKKVYRKGDSFMEAMNVKHRGMNEGESVVVILALFIGSKDQLKVIKE